MTRELFIKTRNFILVALAQVLIFSQIHLFGYATACIFTIFLLKMPRHTTRNEIMVWAFLFGIITDMFCNTPGIHAAAATAMGFSRNYILAAFTHKGMPDNFVPGAKSIKWGSDRIYASTCIAIFYTLLFFIEFFTIEHIGALFLSILYSTLLTMCLVVVVEYLSQKK